MINTLLSSWRAAPRPALLGLLLFFCAGFADGVLMPFFPLWASSEAGIPVGAVGLLFGCYAGGELLAAPLIGGIADRVGRRPVLIASSIGVGAGFLALFFVHGVVVTAIVLLLTGMCESVLHPTILTAIADVTASSAHPRWFSLARVSSSAGQILGPACGALLALVSLRSVFLAGGTMLVLGGMVMLLALNETIGTGRATGDDRHDGEADEEEEGLSALLPAFRDGRLAKLLLWVVLFEVAGNWIEAVIPLYAHGAGTLTPSRWCAVRLRRRTDGRPADAGQPHGRGTVRSVADGRCRPCDDTRLCAAGRLACDVDAGRRRQPVFGRADAGRTAGADRRQCAGASRSTRLLHGGFIGGGRPQGFAWAIDRYGALRAGTAPALDRRHSASGDRIARPWRRDRPGVAACKRIRAGS